MSEVVPLRDASARCGAKAWHLGRLMRAGFPVPDGFVVTDPSGDEIEHALRRLGSGPFAVRSSALGEDGATASFAGQLHTTLGATTTVEVIEAARRGARSGRTRGAAAYATRTGHAPATVVPVIVQVMVEPQVAGVLFTRHPVTGADEVVIEAARGLGDQVAGGTVTPQTWTVRGRRVDTPAGEPLLTAALALDLADTGRRIEALFGGPQDVEWAITGGQVRVLQARPVTTRAEPTPASAASGEVLVTGTAASPGTATGPVRVITDLADFDRFSAGDVLVCRTTSPAWTRLLARAAAVVTETGGILAHAAIVAREFGIPAVVATPHAMTVLADGQVVVVDGTRGRVVRGTR